MDPTEQLKALLNIGGMVGGAPSASAGETARLAQAAELQRALAQTEAAMSQLTTRQQQLQQAAAALPTLSPEQQAAAQPQLVALHQQQQAEHAQARRRVRLPLLPLLRAVTPRRSPPGGQPAGAFCS